MHNVILNIWLGFGIYVYRIYRSIYYSKFKLNIIAEAGKYSLCIMLLHLLACKIIDVLIIKIFNLPI